MLRFNRPVYIGSKKSYLNADDLLIEYKTRDGSKRRITWESFLFEQPCSYVYIKTDIRGKIKGGLDQDTIVSVQLLDSQIFMDENNQTVRGSISDPIRVHLYPKAPAPKNILADVERRAKMSVNCFWIAIFLWIGYAWGTKNSVMPAATVFMTGQLLFFTAC